MLALRREPFYKALVAQTAFATTGGVLSPKVDAPEGLVNGIQFILDVTALATDTADTLDITVQSFDGKGWVNVAHFTQILGDGSAIRLIMQILTNQAESIHTSGAALAADAVVHFFGDQYRVNQVLVDADADAEFAYTVGMIPF